jgi:hypothetical protein
MGELQQVTMTVQTVNGPEVIEGTRLGSSTSLRGHHNHEGGFAPPGPATRCPACRWTQIDIVFDEGTESYVVVIQGRSVVPGEIDRCRVERTTSPLWVIETLQMPQRRTGSQPRLTKTAIKAIAEAARYDADIADAWRERRPVVA